MRVAHVRNMEEVGLHPDGCVRRRGRYRGSEPVVAKEADIDSDVMVGF